MFEEVKAKLLEQPQSICNILETFGFSHISLRGREIRCGLEYGSNPSAIVIRLHNNDNLWVKDYTRNMSYDLINYIIKAKNVEFKTVINAIKMELGIESLYNYQRKAGLFGGIYQNIGKFYDEIKTQQYPESILDEYKKTPNKRFLNDGLSLESQIRFEVGYDIMTQRITIPIRNIDGTIISVKGRLNYESDEEPKYLYLQYNPVSSCLYGTYQNYNSLYEAEEVYIFESEKSIIKLDTWGIHNAVALMSNSLSTAQARILMSLCPKKIIFMLDEGLPLENTFRNIEILKNFTTMRDIEIAYWDWNNNIDLPVKSSPVDGTREQFDWVLKNELVTVRND